MRVCLEEGIYVNIHGWIKPAQLTWCYEDWLGLHTSMRVENHHAVHCIVIYGFPQHTERFLLLPNVCHAAWPRTAVHWRSAGEMHPGIITTSFPGHPTPVWTSGGGTSVYTSIYIVNQYQGHRFINQQSSFTRFLTIMYTHITANFSCAGRLRVCTVVEHVPITHDRCYAIC